MRYSLTLGILLLSMSVAQAGGMRFGVGCIGVCGKEQTVVDGQTACVVAMDNIASDNDMIQVNRISMTVSHADGDEVMDNILVPVDGDGASPVLISPHSEFQVTTTVKPHAADLELPNQMLPIRFRAFGNVIFNELVCAASPSDDVEFASFGDVTHVLAANPPTCAGDPPASPAAKTALVCRLRRIRNDVRRICRLQ